MEQKHKNKKIAAALAAVNAYLAEEAAAVLNPVAPEPAAPPFPPVRLWGISGRTAQMQNRTLMQMRTFQK